MKGNRLGQAAIEYLAIISIALVLAAPFVIEAQSSIIDLQIGSNAVSVQSSLNNIETAVETVSASGEPATRTFIVDMPQTVNSTQVYNKSVVITINTRNDRVNYSRTFEVNLTGSLPQKPGRFQVKTTAEADSVNLQVVS